MRFTRRETTDLGKRTSLTVPTIKAGAVAVALAVVLSLIGATPANAAEPETERLTGGDRYESSASISGKYAPGVEVAYIASGQKFPDALSAAPAAAVQGGPLLITMAGSLPPVIRAELERLRPKKIVVAGGPESVTEAVYAELRTLTPSIRRDWGVDRYTTSRAVTRAAFPSATAAFVATGQKFPDALTASAVSGGQRNPVILVNGEASTVDADTASLLAELRVSSVEIAGGTASISDSMSASLGRIVGSSNVTRHAGIDRYVTSNSINALSFATAPVVYLAKGTDFPDALSGAALAARDRAPLFIVPTNCVPDFVVETLTGFGTTKIVLLGGLASLSPNIENLVVCTTDLTRSGALLGFTQPFALKVNVSAHFGMRIHPITGVRTMHYGTDYAQLGINGTRIRAVADGVVVAKNNSDAPYGMGNSITLLHRDKIRTQTMHMIAPSNFNIGDTVKASQIIGNVGATGGSTGPHLHFEVWIDKTRVDPYVFLSGAQLARIL